MRTAFENMDRMYRLQRYFYDLTRKYYLIGRDQLLEEMNVRAGERVLEVGCGTARNLIVLARSCPDACLFGLDASAAMLETARSKIKAARAENISVKTALAEEFSFAGTFGLDQPFDKIFFSYSISMIPPWRESVDNALANLKPGGTVFLVDFYDQKALPAPIRKLLQWWLAKFHVHFRPKLLHYFAELHGRGTVEFRVTPVSRRYAFTASLFKN